MAHNFKMNIHRRIDKLTIRLAGDFDGSSAWELINAIRENLNNLKFVKIDTGELKVIYPFGREVFRNNMSNAKNTRIRMQFSGPNALQIAPPDECEKKGFRGYALELSREGMNVENKRREKSL